MTIENERSDNAIKTEKFVCLCGGLFVRWFVCAVVCLCGGLFVRWFVCAVVCLCGGLFVRWFVCCKILSLIVYMAGVSPASREWWMSL